MPCRYCDKSLNSGSQNQCCKQCQTELKLATTPVSTSENSNVYKFQCHGQEIVLTEREVKDFLAEHQNKLNKQASESFRLWKDNNKDFRPSPERLASEAYTRKLERLIEFDGFHNSNKGRFIKGIRCRCQAKLSNRISQNKSRKSHAAQTTKEMQSMYDDKHLPGCEHYIMFKEKGVQ